MFRSRYIPFEGEQNLREYKYVGVDKSIIYRYILSPFCQFCVDHIIPPWLAPNVITLIGLILCLIPHFMLYWMFPDAIYGEIPTWMCFLQGTLILTYLVLDNIDGKQARKTQTSSPLGLLFDHGCDAIQTFISGLNIFSCLQLGNNIRTLLGWQTAMLPFYFATWEEYYMDSLNLGYLNGATEGIVGLAFIHFMTCFTGGNFWLETSFIPSLNNNEIVMIIFGVLAIGTSSLNVYEVYSKRREQFSEALSNVITFAYIAFSSNLIGCLSPTNILATKTRFIVYIGGLSFAKLTGVLQASHVAKIPYRPERKGIWIIYSILNINALYGYINKTPLINEEFLIDVCLVVTIIIYTHFVLNIIWQFTEVLNIKVFVIKPKKN